MKVIGELKNLDLVAVLSPLEADLIRAAEAMVTHDSAGAGPWEGGDEPVAPTGQARGGQRKKVARPARRAALCKVCGVKREGTPWPKQGAVCLACNRKRVKAAYAAKHGKPVAPAGQARGGQEKPVRGPTGDRLAAIRAADERARKRVEDGVSVNPKEFGL